MAVDEKDLILEKLNEAIERERAEKKIIKERCEALKSELLYVRSVCVSATLAAGDRWRKARDAGITQHDKSILALQYRDYLFIYSRMFKTELVLVPEMMADVNLIIGSHSLIG